MESALLTPWEAGTAPSLPLDVLHQFFCPSQPFCCGRRVGVLPKNLGPGLTTCMALAAGLGHTLAVLRPSTMLRESCF